MPCDVYVIGTLSARRPGCGLHRRLWVDSLNWRDVDIAWTQANAEVGGGRPIAVRLRANQAPINVWRDAGSRSAEFLNME